MRCRLQFLQLGRERVFARLGFLRELLPCDALFGFALRARFRTFAGGSFSLGGGPDALGI